MHSQCGWSMRAWVFVCVCRSSAVIRTLDKPPQQCRFNGNSLYVCYKPFPSLRGQLFVLVGDFIKITFFVCVIAVLQQSLNGTEHSAWFSLWYSIIMIKVHEWCNIYNPFQSSGFELGIWSHYSIVNKGKNEIHLHTLQSIKSNESGGDLIVYLTNYWISRKSLFNLKIT